MSEPNVLEQVLELLRPDATTAEETARQHAHNVQAGLQLIAHKLDDWDAAIDGWKEVWGYGNVSPLGTIFRAKKAGEWVGIDVPGPTIDDVVQWFRGTLEPVRDNVRRASDLLRPYVENPGNPDHIVSVADAWSNEVQGPVSGLSEWFSETTLLVDDAWRGPAATAYRDFIPGQHAAVSEIAARAKGLKDALTDLGVALSGFWTDLDISISGAVIELASMTLGLFDVNAVDKAGELVEHLNERIGELVRRLSEAESAYIQAASELTGMMNDNTHSPASTGPDLPCWAASPPTRPTGHLNRRSRTSDEQSATTRMESTTFDAAAGSKTEAGIPRRKDRVHCGWPGSDDRLRRDAGVQRGDRQVPMGASSVGHLPHHTPCPR